MLSIFLYSPTLLFTFSQDFALRTVLCKFLVFFMNTLYIFTFSQDILAFSQYILVFSQDILAFSQYILAFSQDILVFSQDITLQHLCSEGCVELTEKCARFHIMCSYTLCLEEMAVFDQKMNHENLTKCLITLKQFYRDLRIDRVWAIIFWGCLEIFCGFWKFFGVECAL